VHAQHAVAVTLEYVGVLILIVDHDRGSSIIEILLVPPDLLARLFVIGDEPAAVALLFSPFSSYRLRVPA
jgi:hypothetical protein